MLEARNITKSWQNKAGSPNLVLDHCNLKLKQGQSLGLMGTSGSGKSTLARILLGLASPDIGKIFFDGQPLNSFNRKNWLHFRRRVQFISQSPECFWEPRFTVGKSLEEVIKIHSLCRKDEWTIFIDKYLYWVKIRRQLLSRYPHQLSGGELQRLSICRSLLLEPQILILDEPVSMLDVSVQAQIMQLLRKLKTEKDMTYLFISHDRTILQWFCDETLNLRQGKLFVSE
ncbi:ABC transporter ATP-binding protein [Pectinatus haikarae]|uniref:ABC-type glutathione transport system ATPase component n=1 Tax=Pectinatus haikarae TaxID=349096 RepID=A0ABT9Y9Z3_9FIRM|nr:dipeptide/oligopeptide/nickel ABC transporter ATP-binding protein [Pectinatus haikarae]MDQ0204663.1 ABC-type glutathione transport system ATPase component [Pectinatus haikarae]